MKPGSYTQIYIHYVIVVSHRDNLIHEKQQLEVYPFISGLINSMGHKSLAVNGVPNHVHIFMGFNPDKSPSETIKEIKGRQQISLIQKNGFPGNLPGNQDMAVFRIHVLR